MTSLWNGKKIKLRRIMKKDLDGYFSVNNIDTDIQRLSGNITFPIHPQKMERYIDDHINKDSSDNVLLIIEDYEGHVVGDINTSDCNNRFGTFKYGIGINKEHWGKGYGSEAVKLVLNYYFNELRYQKVNVSVYSFNTRSVSFHKSIGFKEEGRLKRMVYTNGTYHDEIVLGMTVEEFNKSTKESLDC